MGDDADRWVVLALPQVPFLGKCDDQGVGPQGWLFSCLPDLVADCRESGDYALTLLLGRGLLGYCQLQLTSLSSMVVLQSPNLCLGGRPLCLSGDSSVLMDLH